ncbi:MAG: aromatic ring-hydroxylating dioxygenase subunit alpha [Rhodospirillaceae bacterium]|nr:aromatic ring-hydroxylating dioxygenase subunit alpha [Rhodospirillaceae bacterium]
MLSAAQNDLLTRTGPGTAGGALMRRYWQPIALSEELAPESDNPRPVKAVRLLGLDLVLFRDEAGRLGLIDRHCCHRGADLAFGRLENGGLRCPFHGWLYDTNGACLEQPAEPEGSDLHRRVRQPAYPCRERNGMIFAWLGEGEPQPLPDLDCFAAPEAYSFAWKGWWECNWLQALEVGVDPAHASFLHRFFEDDDARYGQQFRDRTGDMAQTAVFREYDRPDIHVETTGYGLRLITLRDLGDGRRHVRVTNQVFPHGIVIPISATMNITQWHVPIDDENCFWYTLFTDYSATVDKGRMRADRIGSCTLPDYRSIHSRADNWGYDPAEQRLRTYTGMGEDINFHDQWAVESPGPVHDRTKENLGTTDAGIMAYRRILRRALKEAEEDGPVPFESGAADDAPLSIDTIGPAAEWRTVWRKDEAARRARSPWAAALANDAPVTGEAAE